MIIESLELNHFRNYETLIMDFEEGTNILYGDNAQGKTNILESIYLSGTTKSHKRSKDREIIQFGYDESHIRVFVKKQEKKFQIDIHLKKNRSKGIAINQIPIRKASELFGILNTVFFSPEDLNIIKNGPLERRRFMDMELSQLDKIYLNHLEKYHKVLSQRNKLLNTIPFQPDLIDTLPIWDMQLFEYGKKIIKRRREFVDQLNEIASVIHKNITGGKEEMIISYEPNISEDNFEEALHRFSERDLRQKMTTTGPHKDDMAFFIQNEDIRRFGSRGQQRTAALSLKLSEIEIVKKITKEVPVLLLDDVLSELDSSRQNYLLENIKNIQTIITCTGLDEFIHNRFHMNRIFEVVNGKVTVYKNETVAQVSK